MHEEARPDPGILSMGNHVGQPNRSQYLLHTKEAPDYDEEPPHVAFGQVVTLSMVVYGQIFSRLRAAQLKMRETEIAHAKQKIAYESEYERAEALRRWPWLRSRVL
ncbi:hypothetical protein HID58_046421, partial [Brassica napus]